VRSLTFNTVAGSICVKAENEHINSIKFVKENDAHAIFHTHDPILNQCRSEILQYLEGKRKIFEFPMVDTGTIFHQEVRRSVMQIPFGSTVTYSELARQMGRPEAIRAIAAANASNPLLIAIPCHRVIGKHGDLTGYAGGLPVKTFLLQLEGKSIGIQQGLFI
jgi:O-6-methylguanine DNA methyltransferase